MHTIRLAPGLFFATLGIVVPVGLVGCGAAATAGSTVPAAAGTMSDSRSGTDVSGADVRGVRLYMTYDEARAALQHSLPTETTWRDTAAPCADEHAASGAVPGSPAAPADVPVRPTAGSCLASAVLGGGTGVVLRFVEDLPAHPHRSIVTEIVLSQEPVRDDSKRRFHLALLHKYGPPDLSDPTGMQWGQVLREQGRSTLLRTRPMLESSNDEIIRLSDTGLEERVARLVEARRCG